jgi:hypothetical protein
MKANNVEVATRFAVAKKSTNDFWITMAIVVAVRIAVFVAGVLSFAFVIPNPQPTHPIPHMLWVTWDAGAYWRLAIHGYATTTADDFSIFIAYFPLYPICARALSVIFSPQVALVLISNVCSLIGFAVMYSWIRNLASERVARISVLVFATSMSAVFLCAGMTEGMFFMLVAITLWLMQQNRLYTAAIVCALASATRPTGIALAGTLALQVLIVGRGAWSPRLGRAILIGLIASAGALSYEAFLWHRYHDPLVYTHAQGTWEKLTSDMQTHARQQGEPPRYSKAFLINRLTKPQTWNYAVAMIMLIITLIGFFKPGPMPRVIFLFPLAIFILTAFPNHGLRMSSVIRYESAGLPIFVLVGYWLTQIRRQSLVPIFLAAQFALQIYYAVLFCSWTWVG